MTRLDPWRMCKSRSSQIKMCPVSLAFHKNDEEDYEEDVKNKEEVNDDVCNFKAKNGPSMPESFKNYL